jgi:hypothetical protein
MRELEGTKHGALMTSRDAFAYAAEQGVDVRYPMANELFIDIDDARGQHEFDENWPLITDIFKSEGKVIVWITPSRRKPEGKHIVVTLPRNVTPLERIALQAAMGSDPRRECHSMRRYFAGDPLPTLFFEKRT